MMKKLQEVFSKHNINLNDKFAVAVSGGVDSLSLVFMLTEFIDRKNILALTVDHNLRNGSKREAEYVHQLLAEYNIRHEILEWHHDEVESAIQEMARNNRYRLLIEAAQRQECQYLLTAHTMDDQAETVLQRILKSSGIKGLSAIAQLSQRDNINLFRPLLNFTKDELYDYLQVKNIKHIEDPSNNNIEFQRVAIRKFLNQKNNYIDYQKLRNGLANIAKNLSYTNDLINYYLEKEISASIIIDDLRYIKLKTNYFLQLPFEMQFKILEYALIYVNPQYKKNIRFEKLDNLIQNMIDKYSITNSNCCGCVIQQEHDNYLIIRESGRINNNKILLDKKGEYIWDNRFKIKLMQDYDGDLYCSKAQSMQEFKDIRQDLNINISPQILLSLPMIYDKKNIIAIPILGYYQDIFLQDLINIDRL